MAAVILGAQSVLVAWTYIWRSVYCGWSAGSFTARDAEQTFTSDHRGHRKLVTKSAINQRRRRH